MFYKRIPAKKFNSGIPTRSKSTNIPTSKTQETHHTRKEGAIERWTPAQRLVVRSRPGKLRRGWMWWLELMCCWWWCFIHLRESQWLEWCQCTLAPWLNTTVKRCVVSRRCKPWTTRTEETCVRQDHTCLSANWNTCQISKSSPVYHGWYHQSCWTGLRSVPGSCLWRVWQMHVDYRSTHDATDLESAICWCQDRWQHDSDQIFHKNQRSQACVLRLTSKAYSNFKNSYEKEEKKQCFGVICVEM